MKLAEPPNKNPIQYAELPWMKPRGFDWFYDKYILRGNFIEGLQDSIC